MVPLDKTMATFYRLSVSTSLSPSATVWPQFVYKGTTSMYKSSYFSNGKRYGQRWQ